MAVMEQYSPEWRGYQPIEPSGGFDWRAALRMFLDQSHDLRDVLKGEFLKIFGRKNPRPCIENLHDVRTGIDLRDEILCNGIRKLAKKEVRIFPPCINHLLRVVKIFRAFALNHIGKERPRSAGKTDEGNAAI